MPEDQLIVETWHVLTLVVVPMLPIGAALAYVWRTATRRKVWEAGIESRFQALKGQVDEHQRFDDSISQRIQALHTEMAAIREAMVRMETVLHIRGMNGRDGA